MVMSSMESSSELQEIVPEPIILEPIGSNSSKSPHSGSPSSPSYPTLRRVLNYLTKLQKYSAYSFASFLGLHLASVAVVPGLGASLPISQEIFEMSRSVYQTIPNFENIIIIGSSLLHIGSGIGIRLIKNKLRNDNRSHNKNKLVYEPIIKDDERGDIGLGGITGLIGLGYKKSWISTKCPNLSPLSFSGYCLIPLGLYHYLKFRYLPKLVDGDSSLINLSYISYYLNYSPLKTFGNVVNFIGLGLLVWMMMYHSVSGLLKLNKKYSFTFKKYAYLAINGISLLGLISLVRFKRMNIDFGGFIGQSFIKYLSSFYV